MRGEIVKSLIISKGYNVAQVAELIGTSQQNLASALKHTDIRTGRVEGSTGLFLTGNRVSLSILFQVAECLEV